MNDEEDYYDIIDSDYEDGGFKADSTSENSRENFSRNSNSSSFRFSHFFKAMTVDFDQKKSKDGVNHVVEWKKPPVPSNTAALPAAADFDRLEFMRGGDENVNITINLFRDETPERFLLKPALSDILDTDIATRAEALMGLWDYIKLMGLQEDDEKRSFDCDNRLKMVSSLVHFLFSRLLTKSAPTTRKGLYSLPRRQYQSKSITASSR